MRCIPLALSIVVVGVSGCSSTATRIRENPAVFAGLDAGTQERIQQGKIEVGDPEEAVRLALGRPRRIAKIPDGGVWFYSDRPRDPRDYISGGFRRRVLFDPVTRTNVVTVEPVGDHLFPNLRTHTTQVTLRGGRVADIAVVEDW